MAGLDGGGQEEEGDGRDERWTGRDTGREFRQKREVSIWAFCSQKCRIGALCKTGHRV